MPTADASPQHGPPPRPFVGRARRELVRALRDEFASVQQEGARPRLVTLEAVTGWGKTRILQELYAMLAAEQAAPAYWPPTIAGAARHDHASSTHGTRKLVFPEVVDNVATDREPTFFWWGITATRRQSGQVPIQALAQDMTQLAYHAEPLDRRFAHVASVRQRAARVARRRGGSLATEIAASAAGEAVVGGAASAGATIAGPVGAVIGFSVGMVLKYASELRGTASEVGDATDEDRKDLVEPIATALSEFARAGIPLIIVVEDLHTADASLVALLHRLLDGPAAPILILGTCWPGLLEEAERPAVRLVREVPVASVTRYGPDALRGLEADERLELVDGLLPGLARPDAEMLAEHFMNPLALELGVRMEVVRRAITAGTLASDLADVPRDVEGVFRLMWQELPEALRRALTLAVLSSPAGVAAHGAFASVGPDLWDPALIARAAEATPWLQREIDLLEERLARVALQYGWARQVDDWLRTWLEPAQHEIAAGNRTAFCTGSELRAYYAELSAGIDLSEVVPDSRRLAAAQLLVTLALEGHVAWSAKEFAAADLLIDTMKERADVDGLRHLVAVIDRMPDSGDARAFARREARATAVGRLGQVARARDEMAQLVAERTRHGEADAPDVLAQRADLATWTGRAGDAEGARRQFAELLEQRASVLPPSDPALLRTRSNLATWVGRSGDVREAVRLFTELLEDRVRHLGPAHPDTLRTRSNLATWSGRAGDPAGAAEQFAVLLGERIRVLGPDHPDVLRTRSNLARWRGRAGDPDAAVRGLEEVLEDRISVLGPDHPDVLRTRGSLLHWRHRAGDTDGSSAAWDELRADLVRVLGPDHPEVVRATALSGDLLDATTPSGDDPEIP